MSVTVAISHPDIKPHDAAQLASHMLEPPKITIAWMQEKFSCEWTIKFYLILSLIFTMAETKAGTDEKGIERDKCERWGSIRK